MTPPEKQKLREAIERPHSWFPDQYEWALKMAALARGEDRLPDAEERQIFGSRKLFLKEER
jgi:hypothetical protein